MRKSECAALENIHTLLMEGYWKLQGSWGSQMSKVREESMKLNWNSQKGWGGIQMENLPWGCVDISRTTQCTLHISRAAMLKDSLQRAKLLTITKDFEKVQLCILWQYQFQTTVSGTKGCRGTSRMAKYVGWAAGCLSI